MMKYDKLKQSLIMASICLVLLGCTQTQELVAVLDNQLTEEEKLIAAENEAKVMLGENIGMQIFIRAIELGT